MKITKVLVGISKIADHYDALISGFGGVLYDGISIRQESLKALQKCAELGKKVVIVTNSSLRVRQIAELLSAGGTDISFLTAVVSAGELIHYALRTPKALNLGGTRYYNLGNDSDKAVFDGLFYTKVESINQADFIFLGGPKTENDDLSVYKDELEQACTRGLPLVCAGNDLCEFVNGHESLSCGAVAEQYAVLGGRIITFGKPQADVLRYATESLSVRPNKILLIGDSMSADIKAADLFGTDSVLITKGIHTSFLGEGYIPDAQKARDLSARYDTYADYVLSGLRW